MTLKIRRMFCLLSIALLGASSCLRASDQISEAVASEGWSQDLLARLLATPTAENGAEPERTQGMVMHSYQLHFLHLGEPGRATNLVNILKRMLPAESRVTEETATNTLHVFTLEVAQSSVVELLAAMDAEALPSVSAAPSILPDEVRKTLENLAANRPESEALLKTIRDVSASSEARVAGALVRSRQESSADFRSLLIFWTMTSGAVVIAGMILGGLWLRAAHFRLLAKTEQASAVSKSLVATVPTMDQLLAASETEQKRMTALQQTLEGMSIAFQANQQRTSQAMELVVRKQGEITVSLARMEELRREIGGAAGDAFMEINRAAIDRVMEEASRALQSRVSAVGEIAEVASKKLDATANRLEVQNDRVEKLAQELERTQHELDTLYGKLEHARLNAKEAEEEANRQRILAHQKSAELARREAALASLSLLLQETEESIVDTLDSVQGEGSAGDGFGAAEPKIVDFADASGGTPDHAPDAAAQQTAIGDNLPTTCPTNSRTFKILPAS